MFNHPVVKLKGRLKSLILPISDAQHRELGGVQQEVCAISKDRSFLVEPFGLKKEEGEWVRIP